MSYFDDRPNHFRLLIGLFAAYLFVLAAMNFSRNASWATDENLFRTSPSNLYVTKSFPAELLRFTIKKNPALSPPSSSDSVRLGEFLVEIDDQEIGTAAELQDALYAREPDAIITLTSWHPATNATRTFRLARAALPDSFFRELPPSIYITDVAPGGASDRAGMQVGDVIVRINRQGFRDATDADRIMRRAGGGSTIAYDLIRGPRNLTLHVTLAKLGINLGMVMSLLTGLSFLGLGTFIAMYRPRIHAARLLGLMFVSFSFPLLLIYQRGSNASEYTHLFFFMMILSILLGVTTAFHSGFYFPKMRPELMQKPWLYRAPYLMAALSFLLIAGAGFSNLAMMRLFFLSAIALLLFYYIGFHLVYRKQRSAEYKFLSRRLSVICWLAGLAALAIVLLGFGRANESLLGFASLPFLMIPAGYLYVINRHRLLDMSLRVRRNRQYEIVAAVWIVFLLALAVASLVFLTKLSLHLPDIHFTGSYLEITDTPMAPERREFIEKVVLMMLAMAVIFVFQRIWRAGQAWIARKFHRESYNYSVATSELAEVMATKLNMVDLARGIVQKLSTLMHLERVGVMFFQNQNTCCCHEAYGFDGRRWEEFCLAADQKIVNILDKFRSESRFSVDYLPEDVKSLFFNHGFRHLVPIRFKEKLVGTMLLGEKLSEAAYTHEDFAILTAIAKQASVAVENAFLYEELAEQERLKHELAIARRIQMASLPQNTPKVEGLEIAGISIPALEVGGDYFDYLNGVPNRITIIVGDVSGKGTSAALYMSKVQGILRSLHDFGLSPRQLFIRANHLLRQALERKSFVTSIGGDFNTTSRQLALARAGHLPLFYYHARRAHVEKITPKGLGLGLDDDGIFASELEERIIAYEPGDVFLFVTDGVTEAHNGNGAEFGEDQLAEVLAQNVHNHAEQIRDKVISALKLFANNIEQHDDQTIVVVKATH